MGYKWRSEKRDEMIRRLANSGKHTQKEIAQAVGLTKMRINQIVNESGSKETLQVPNVTNSDLTVTAKLKDEVESLRRKLEEAEAARRSTEQRLSAVQSDLKTAKMALDRSSYPGIPEHSLPV